MFKPDYTTLREKTPFTWHVNMSYYVMAELAGVTLHDLFTNYKASVKLYSKENFDKFNKFFPMHEKIKKLTPSTPPISYGHINMLGVDLAFPDGNGEVNYARSDKSLDEWISILDRPVDFSVTGMVPFYLEYRENMKKAMNIDNVNFGMAYQGPITTAYTLLDLQLYYDIYDEPEKLKVLLGKLIRSIIQFKKFYCQVNNVDYKYTPYLSDDCAALIPADMWEEFVIPYMDIFYSDVNADRRSLHSEGMVYKHLKNLETLGITRFDPSVSPQLDPVIIYNNCQVPFLWRMCSIYHDLLDRELAMDFVFASVRDGASGVFSCITELKEHNKNVVEGFIQACEIVEDMLKKGAGRADVGAMMSSRGKDIFWEKWRTQYI